MTLRLVLAVYGPEKRPALPPVLETPADPAWQHLDALDDPVLSGLIRRERQRVLDFAHSGLPLVDVAVAALIPEAEDSAQIAIAYFAARPPAEHELDLETLPVLAWGLRLQVSRLQPSGLDRKFGGSTHGSGSSAACFSTQS